MGEDRLARLQKSLAPLKDDLISHPVYGEIETLPRLRLFMEQHVFAVWDFMSLLKTLQGELCGTGVPWLPPEDPQAARMINEIVLGEESDGNGRGGFASHFELYRRAMVESGADTSSIDRFVSGLREGLDVPQALECCEAPESVRQFVRQTFDLIESGDLCHVAAAFLFGREDLLPDLFQRIVDELDRQSGGGLAEFRYYLTRHIELDGGEHGPLAGRLMMRLCGTSDLHWKAAEEAAIAALRARRRMWDGIEAELRRLSPDH